MEMRVNSSLIRSEREKRAWSQEHLAKIAGLGLRTIQRIETTGAASYESVSAIASVLLIPVTDLKIAEPAKQSLLRLSNWRVRLAGVGAACVATAFSILLVRTAFGEELVLDVGLSWNDGEERAVRVLAEEGKEAEISIDDVLRIVIVPTIRDDGSILLSAKIYEFEDSEPKLLSEPRVATLADKVAQIQQGSDSGNVYSFLITPKLQ